MEKVRYRIALLGARADKTELLRMCMPGRLRQGFSSLSEQHDVPIVMEGADDIYGKQIELVNGQLEGKSNLIPSHVHIFCGNGDDTGLTVEREDFADFDKIVFVISWQYEHSMVRNMIEKGKEKRKGDIFFEREILLVESRVKQGSTDIGQSVNPMETVAQTYRKEYPDIYIAMVERDAFVWKALSPRPLIAAGISKEYREKFKRWKESIEDQYGLKFYYFVDAKEKIEDGYINETVLNEKVCGFSEVNKGRSIAEEYVNNFARRSYGDVEKILVDFYDVYTKEVRVWDHQREMKAFRECLRELYQKKMQDLPRGVLMPESLAEYNRIKTKSEIHTEFYKRLREFYEQDALKEMKERLQRKADKIERYLGRDSV